ncbi:hypothetical protein [Desulfovibrio sp.]|uniref:hypothetical protein n=1 Tax=Desulfovibrio sp. TaxID=885 RepID=UPI0025B883B7|nr:hypothetical protein [Desulfovibrio sp.]
MEILTYQQRIGLVLRHIEQHLDDRPNLEELARIACFSPYHFHRIFSSMGARALRHTCAVYCWSARQCSLGIPLNLLPR